MITVNGLIQRETNILDIKGRAFEQSIARNNQIMTHIYKTFTFIDDPEGAAKCQRENPDTLVLQIRIIDPAICEHRPCKTPACTCLQNYRLPLAEQNIRGMPYRWMYTRSENPTRPSGGLTDTARRSRD